jgi:phenylpyruvate tautomerase PptA (4-oxalocrotonate tautomerase family)
MPLVRISVRRDVPSATRRAIGDAIQQAMVETINVPTADRFQIWSEHDGDGLVYDPGYLGIRRDDGFLVVQITLSFGRSVELKKALFRRIADLVSAHGVRQENIFINLVETAKENWSFGNGQAQYADAPPAHLAAAQ